MVSRYAIDDYYLVLEGNASRQATWNGSSIGSCAGRADRAKTPTTCSRLVARM